MVLMEFCHSLEQPLEFEPYSTGASKAPEQSKARGQLYSSKTKASKAIIDDSERSERGLLLHSNFTPMHTQIMARPQRMSDNTEPKKLITVHTEE